MSEIIDVGCLKEVCVCVLVLKIVVGSQRVLHIQLNLIHVYGNRDSTVSVRVFVCAVIIIIFFLFLPSYNYLNF